MDHLCFTPTKLAKRISRHLLPQEPQVLLECCLKMEAQQRNLHVLVGCLRNQFRSRMILSNGGLAITSKSARVQFLIVSRNMSCFVNHHCSCLVQSQLLAKQLQIGQMGLVLVAYQLLQVELVLAVKRNLILLKMSSQ